MYSLSRSILWVWNWPLQDRRSQNLSYVMFSLCSIQDDKHSVYFSLMFRSMQCFQIILYRCWKWPPLVTHLHPQLSHSLVCMTDCDKCKRVEICVRMTMYDRSLYRVVGFMLRRKALIGVKFYVCWSVFPYGYTWAQSGWNAALWRGRRERYCVSCGTE